ncbi:hypothetical protein MPTK1_2g22840 [Marchantia polymorpha subsp. ruderalis]|uniref:Uncharacterized protein n=1 Tax=Marchantia polymorpha TaxID=3197 RepID=A0A2R6WN73_MARPO|nr:hypothetical protein MARPO_0072s0048 [Marchantia polymorpha]BBN03349.1 hypothetical protein Mp_2g22840 [Marchantia polymorpha subsp. ruderalis]|eukprot:PTQ35303.1 hypothetical protein MARPO_0072s0048 [Marchantia polymorpha]
MEYKSPATYSVTRKLIQQHYDVRAPFVEGLRGLSMTIPPFSAVNSRGCSLACFSASLTSRGPAADAPSKGHRKVLQRHLICYELQYSPWAGPSLGKKGDGGQELRGVPDHHRKVIDHSPRRPFSTFQRLKL